jgi:hypothetical protein
MSRNPKDVPTHGLAFGKIIKQQGVTTDALKKLPTGPYREEFKI